MLLLVLILVLVMSVSMAFTGFLLYTSRSSTKMSNTPVSVQTIQDGSLYTISSGGTYIGHDFDRSRGKGKMCDAMSTSRDTAAKFKFTKDGDSWTISTDCDGDSKYTSFLNGSLDLIASRDKKSPTTQRWYVNCSASGCSLQNKKSKTYLGGSFTSPTFSKTASYYTVYPA